MRFLMRPSNWRGRVGELCDVFGVIVRVVSFNEATIF